MLLRFILGFFIALLLGQLADMDSTPLILVFIAYFIGILHKNILIKLESKNAKK
jgi:hypothetical protein